MKDFQQYYFPDNYTSLVSDVVLEMVNCPKERQEETLKIIAYFKEQNLSTWRALVATWGERLSSKSLRANVAAVPKFFNLKQIDIADCRLSFRCVG
jgi:hypothetical protein